MKKKELKEPQIGIAICEILDRTYFSGYDVTSNLNEAFNVLIEFSEKKKIQWTISNKGEKIELTLTTPSGSFTVFSESKSNNLALLICQGIIKMNKLLGFVR